MTTFQTSAHHGYLMDCLKKNRKVQYQYFLSEIKKWRYNIAELVFDSEFEKLHDELHSLYSLPNTVGD
jgi:hypothetical protein